VGNALKFTKRGEILIKVEKMEDMQDKVKILFIVKDTGIGIPEDKLERVFDSFTQADGSHTRQYGGTGLGLSISRQLIELMGGEIDVESELGVGTTFWFTAVFEKSSGQTSTIKKGAVDLDGLKVLTVDDNETNRNIFINYLKSWGCRPVEATSSKEALAILKASISLEEPFDLIISDFQMPDENGFDLAKQVRAIDDLKAIPFIILTSVGMRGDGKICKDIGIEGYLTKPIRKRELQQGILLVFTLLKAAKADGKKVLVTRHTIAERFRKKYEILLAEDYPTNQKVVMRHLRTAGFQVDLAENGQLAVEAYLQKPYDLILMDVQMPQMDGYEATRQIRHLERYSAKNGENPNQGKRTPIIALTAYAVKGDRDKCLQAGMDDYIAKPIKREELLDRVGKWFLVRHDNTDCNERVKVSDNEEVLID
jgi:CheY-like chemotaxis protein